MTLRTQRQYIETRFQTMWASTVGLPVPPVSWDNTSFTPPNNAAWCRLSVLPQEERQITLGAVANWRTTGVIVVQIFVPKGSGTDTIRGYADAVSTIFRGARFDGIVCQDPSITIVGPDSNGPWFQANVSVPYRTDATH